MRKPLFLQLLALCFFFFSLRISGQQPSDTIDRQNIHHQLLEQLIEKCIDSLRTQKDRSALVFDSILYIAAADHAQYLLSKRSLTHTQTTSKKRTAQKRVEYYGGEGYYVGENIALTYIQTAVNDGNNRDYTNYTYKATSLSIINIWRQSSAHYQNLLNPQYNHTAVAVAYDEKTKRLIAVQVFAIKQ
ncbi:MAG: CAP domain-containing protein [Bacteroidales bacterium]|nr:CAP domain-containing protein [Bacteroidales bacterium]